LPNFDRRLIQRPRESFGCEAFTPNPRETCVLIGTNRLGIRPSNLALERDLRAAKWDAIAKKEKLNKSGNQILGHLRYVG
jgi:hypothetical protein